MKYDRDGDQHYDVASALIKSIRGSDVDAALHYLARMIEAGEDPRFIARRLMISASEDIGLADPTALPTAVAAAQAVAMIGFPEAALTLSHATIALALAPKSNAATTAIGAALADVRAGLAGPVPPHLRDGHYKGAAKLGHAQGYVYPHDVPGGIAAQQYAPDAVHGKRYYEPTRYGAEARYADVVEKVRERLRGDAAGPRSPVLRSPARPDGPAQCERAASKSVCIARRSSRMSRTGSGKSKRASKQSRSPRSAPAARSGPAPAGPARRPSRSARSARSPSSAHSSLHLSLCAECRCWSSSVSWATSGSTDRPREVLRLDASAPHRSSTHTSPTSSRSIMPAGLRARPGTQVSQPETQARPRIRWGTETGATSVISSTAVSSSSWACVAARTAGESAGNQQEHSPSGAHGPGRRRQLLGACGRPAPG